MQAGRICSQVYLFSPRVENQEVQNHRAEVQNHKAKSRNPKRQNGSITLGIKTRNNAGTLTVNWQDDLALTHRGALVKYTQEGRDNETQVKHIRAGTGNHTGSRKWAQRLGCQNKTGKDFRLALNCDARVAQRLSPNSLQIHPYNLFHRPNLWIISAWCLKRSPGVSGRVTVCHHWRKNPWLQCRKRIWTTPLLMLLAPRC